MAGSGSDGLVGQDPPQAAQALVGPAQGELDLLGSGGSSGASG